MEIVVCIKRVPMTQEADLQIDTSGRAIRAQALPWVLNDWDQYALEEAIRLKEVEGGSVTAFTVGVEEDEEVLRRALAMGADRAVRIDPGARILDSTGTAKALAQAILREVPHPDLILTGVQAEDDNAGAVGIMVAELLGLPHAAVVNGLEVRAQEALIRLELEGGLDEVAALTLPALLTLQSGINEPRYVSIMGIRKAGRKTIALLSLEDLGLTEDELLPRVEVLDLSLPPEATNATFLEGDPGEVADQLLGILAEKGVMG